MSLNENNVKNIKRAIKYLGRGCQHYEIVKVLELQ